MYEIVCSCTPLWIVMLLTPRESITSNVRVDKFQIKRDNNVHVQACCEQNLITPVQQNYFHKISLLLFFFCFLCQQGEALPDSKEAERLLLGYHKHIFIPDDIERKLAELPGK